TDRGSRGKVAERGHSSGTVVCYRSRRRISLPGSSTGLIRRYRHEERLYDNASRRPRFARQRSTIARLLTEDWWRYGVGQRHGGVTAAPIQSWHSELRRRAEESGHVTTGWPKFCAIDRALARRDASTDFDAATY